MRHAVLCPVCSGRGWLQVHELTTTSAILDEKECHGCSGKGWVEVGQDELYSQEELQEEITGMVENETYKNFKRSTY